MTEPDGQPKYEYHFGHRYLVTTDTRGQRHLDHACRPNQCDRERPKIGERVEK
jgi:hypothetical protein